MAIKKCESCGSTTFKRRSVDSSGELAVCTCGHYNFVDSGDDGSFSFGNITVNGAVAIGDGAVAIQGNTRRKGRR